MTTPDTTTSRELNSVATHPLQTFEWGQFRKKTGVKVIQKIFSDGKKITGGFQLTIHKIPHTTWNIGYLPKGTFPTKTEITELKKIGREEQCIFIQLEPNIESTEQNKENLTALELIPSAHPLFTKYSFILDLTKTEEDLLKNMHPKTRYNIRVAQKHGVEVKEETSDKAFEEYLRLTQETTSRQGFFAHTPSYHKKMWETLKGKTDKNTLSARLLIAWYKPEGEKEKLALTTWVLFVFKDTLYYPYGASSSSYRETMASNLMMWEAIKFGKKLGLKKFDMWGSLGENPNPKDPWFGFHRFKQGYGPRLVEFVGSYDLVINPVLYQIYKIADKLRWVLLRFKK